MINAVDDLDGTLERQQKDDELKANQTNLSFSVDSRMNKNIISCRLLYQL